MKPEQVGLGIPDPTEYGDVASLPLGQEIPYVVQEHLARRAGRHLDVRLGPDQMFSWATKKGMPEPGGKVQLFQTPLHLGSYASYEGPLTGYGAGTVRMHEKGSVIVTKATPNQISFVTAHGKYPQRYTLIRTGKKPTDWLALNTTPASISDIFGKDIPPGSRAEEALGLKKEHYKKTEAEKIQDYYDPNATFSEKLDGAAALYKVMKDRIEAVSYRTSVTGRPIVHTERLQLPKGLNIPPHLVGSILRGEIWGERQPQLTAQQKLASVMLNSYRTKLAQEAIPPQELGGILNASLGVALRKQREQNIRLRNALFNIRYYGKKPVGLEVPYRERLKMIEEILKYLPKEQFHLPEMATTPEAQKKMWEDIQAGRNPRTREGVVIMTPEGIPHKVKILPEHDVYITGIFPGEGRLAGKSAGGFAYSTEPGGPTVGKVGTGLSDELREELMRNQAEYIGRVARIRSQGQFPSGAHRAPALIALHEDVPPVAVEKAAKVITPLQPHQERVAQKVQESNLLVAHGMGSGKTLSSIAAADRMGVPTTVLVPPSLVENYKKEIVKHTKNMKQPVRVMSMPTAVARNTPIEPGNLLIVDEAHGVRNVGTERLRYLKQEAPKASRLMMLTGTPMYNQPSDIAPIINLLKGQQALPEDPTQFAKEYIETKKIRPGLIGRWFFGLKPGEERHLKNVGTMRKVIRGLVDVHSQQEHFPQRTDEEVYSEMSPKQQRLYDYVEGRIPSWLRWKIRMGLPPNKAEAQNLNAFLAGVRQISNTPGPYVRDGSPEASAEMSPKMQAAVQNLQRQREKDKNFRGLIYTNYLEAGALPMSAALTKAGIPHAVFHGGLSPREKRTIVDQYNLGRLPVIIGTSSATEGLDLKGTKLVQILEPHFNEAKLNQVIGRGIRFKSHEHLPPEERRVHVQRFYSQPQQNWLSRMFTGKREGVDQWLAEQARSKARVMDELYQLMKEETGEKTASVGHEKISMVMLSRYAKKYCEAANQKQEWPPVVSSS